jgi:hypothetical protein
MKTRNISTYTQEIMIPPLTRWDPHFKIDEGIRSGLRDRDYTAERRRIQNLV